MAIDVKSIVMDALLALVEDDGVPLERVTVKRLLERSGVSRQTFYNHFLDKNDLICQTYERRMVRAFNGTPRGFAFRDELERSLAHMRNRVGGAPLFGAPSSHTTVRTVRYTAVPRLNTIVRGNVWRRYSIQVLQVWHWSACIAVPGF